MRTPWRRAPARPDDAKVVKSVKRLEKKVAGLDDRLRDLQRTAQRVQEDVGGHGLTGRVHHMQQTLASMLVAEHFDLEAIPYPERLTAQRFRLLSQNEEDGVTWALLSAAGIGPRKVVEIGCGTNGGCTGFLVDELGFEALMVDGHEPNVDAVRRRFNPELLTADQAWITREGIDDVLRRNGFEGEVDVLSIDIDGNDIWVWEALTAVRPRVVILEYNSMFGPDQSVAVPYDPAFHRRAVERTRGLYYGASLTAHARVSARRGYRLVTTDHRGVNAFFLRDDLAPEIPGVTPRRAYRLMDKYRFTLSRGISLEQILADEQLPLETID